MIAALEVGFTWRAPFAVLLLLPVLAALAIRWRRRPFVAMSCALGAAADGPGLPTTWRSRLACLPLLLEGAALAAFVAAIARPVQVEVEPPARLGRDVLLCFDRSSSMAATDLDPARTRLDVARALASEFLAGRRDDRLGLVTFARFADLVCPPTADRTAVVELLEQVRLVDADGPEDATAIGAAVGMAASLLQRSEASGKVLVLLTDGEENVAAFGAPDQIAPLHAGQWCRDHDVRVHTIALGRGAPAADGSWRPLDTTAVQQLAKITGGRFFAAADSAALRGVYQEIDRLEATRFAEPGVRVREWFALPTLVGLALLGAAFLLRPLAAGGAA